MSLNKWRKSVNVRFKRQLQKVRYCVNLIQSKFNVSVYQTESRVTLLFNLMHLASKGNQTWYNVNSLDILVSWHTWKSKSPAGVWLKEEDTGAVPKSATFWWYFYCNFKNIQPIDIKFHTNQVRSNVLILTCFGYISKTSNGVKPKRELRPKQC